MQEVNSSIPFMGSGTTAIAAVKSDRFYVGYDTSNEYVTLAEERISKYTDQIRFEL